MEYIKYDVTVIEGMMEMEIDHSSFFLSFREARIWAISKLGTAGRSASIRCICFSEEPAFAKDAGVAFTKEVWLAVRTPEQIKVLIGS